MELLEIQINHAKIESYHVKLEKDAPEVMVTIGLYAGERQITEFMISTKAWADDNKFALLPDMIPPIKDMAQQLEVIAVRHCRMAMKELGHAVNPDA